MKAVTRRWCLKAAASLTLSGTVARPVLADGGPAFRLGMCVNIDEGVEIAISKVGRLGLPTCMVYTSRFEDRLAVDLKEALTRHQVEATAIMTLGPGNMVWDFLQGPSTLGLVPRATRQGRMDAMKRCSDLAAKAGIRAFQTHCGFIPENPADPLYRETIDAIRDVAGHCRANRQDFLCETGQETPVTMLRVVTDVALDNVGVGLDTANLILCGTGNPVDALEVFGKQVRSIHAKDGRFPTDPKNFGQETPLGEGKVDFPRFLRRLWECGYRGAITIEREIPGERQVEDVRRAKRYLERTLRELSGRSK